MSTTMRRRLMFVPLGLILWSARGTLAAQSPAPAPTTAVLVSLTIRADADRAQVMTVLPDEVRDTLRLYLDGKIQQWYGRSDGRGVVFIMNCATVADAKALMDGLPLAKNHLAEFEFTALGPLSPLRMLIGPPANAKP